MRVLLTTTSFQDTPGPHHALLAAKGWEIIPERGPLPEARMLELIGGVDGLLCGDDGITRAVLQKALPRLRVVSKYGIGLDKIDLAAATELKIPVCFTPGVNHHTVAEHALMLLLALEKNLLASANATRRGEWQRQTGYELHGKTIGVIGLGRVGREVAVRARAFGLAVVGYGNYWDEEFGVEFGVKRARQLHELLAVADYVSLHTKLTPETRGLINARTLAQMKRGVVIINCARGELIEVKAMLTALESGHVRGYGADVLEQEPPPPDHPLLRLPNCLITPHLGSRTHENVVRQATMSVQNLIAVLEGKEPIAQIKPGHA